MEEKIISILNHIHISSEYANEEHIFTGGLLDSLEFTELVTALETSFDMIIDFDDMEPQKFDSVKKICQYIENKHT